MLWGRRRSGLIAPRHVGVPCSMLAATHLIGFGIGGGAPPDPGAGQPQWSTTDKGAGATTADSDRTCALTGVICSIRSAVAFHTAWPRYVEVSATSNPGNTAWRYGLANGDLPVASVALGNDINGLAYRGNDGGIMIDGSVIATSPRGQPSTVFQLATVGGRVWFGENDNWDGDPVAGTGGYDTGLSGYVYLCFGHASTSGSRGCTLQVLGSYAHSPPAGFFAGV